MKILKNYQWILKNYQYINQYIKNLIIKKYYYRLQLDKNI